MCYVVYKLLSRYPSYITFRTARTSVLAYTSPLTYTKKVFLDQTFASTYMVDCT